MVQVQAHAVSGPVHGLGARPTRLVPSPRATLVGGHLSLARLDGLVSSVCGVLLMHQCGWLGFSTTCVLSPALWLGPCWDLPVGYGVMGSPPTRQT